LDVITDPERAGLREHAEDRFIDVPRRIKARVTMQNFIEPIPHQTGIGRLIRKVARMERSEIRGRPSRIPLRFMRATPYGPL
jgi:hypothetical protein